MFALVHLGLAVRGHRAVSFTFIIVTSVWVVPVHLFCLVQATLIRLLTHIITAATTALDRVARSEDAILVLVLADCCGICCVHIASMLTA